MGRRPRARHPHAHDRVVASVSPGRELASALHTDARRHRGRRVGGGVFQRSERRDVPQSRQAPPSRHGPAGARSVQVRHRSRSGGQPAARLPRPECTACRSTAGSAGDVRRRQRVSMRGAVGHRTEPICAGRRTQRTRRHPCGQHRGAHVALEPAPREAHHRAVGEGRPRRVRPQRPALLTMRRHHQVPSDGRAPSPPLLVPWLPDASRSEA